MEMYEWINYYKPKHLRIGDLKKWKAGDVIHVAIFDRNFVENFIMTKIKENRLYTPSYFFKENRHKLIYNGDLTWEIKYSWGEQFCHNVELDIEKFGTDCIWKPMNGEYMKIDKQKIKWSDFNDETRIGWRGPIMLWKDVSSAKKVYFNKYILLD